MFPLMPVIMTSAAIIAIAIGMAQNNAPKPTADASMLRKFDVDDDAGAGAGVDDVEPGALAAGVPVEDVPLALEFGCTLAGVEYDSRLNQEFSWPLVDI